MANNTTLRLPYQQRVVQEKADLDAKLAKLNAFLLTDDFDVLSDVEQGRLTQQAIVMEDYSGILAERIAAFKE